MTILSRHLPYTSRLFARFSSSSTRLAVIGSGPSVSVPSSGLFSTALLLRRLPWLSIDVLDASPVPFGLVRYGVAPDHQEVKNCIHVFEKMFESNRDRLSLFCNVRVGNGPKEVSVNELRSRYSALLLAYGASRPRRLTVKGADAVNVLSGSEVVSWYSGSPSSHSSPLLDHPSAIVIGNGNVALDCARVLARKDSLAPFDIPEKAFKVLQESKVREIFVVGRRGPADVSFTIKELREQFRMEGWSTGVKMEKEDEEHLRESLQSLPRPKKRLMQVLLENTREPVGDKRCTFLFRRSPSEVLSDDNGRVRSVVFDGPGGTKHEIPAGLVIASLGYQSVVLDGLPRNDKGELAMADDTRVAVPGDGARVYASGWCVRGAHGVIADSQGAAQRVTAVMAGDLNEGADDRGIKDVLKSKGMKWTSWDDWVNIDAKEREEGERRGKIREKVVEFVENA